MKTISPIEFGIKENRTLINGKTFDLIQFGYNDIDRFLNFCFKIREKDVDIKEIENGSYYKHAKCLIDKDKENFNHSIFLGVTDKNNENIIATIVAVKRSEDKEIPTEKYFNFNLISFCESNELAHNHIWYFTRLTVDSEFFKANNISYHVSLAITKMLYYTIYDYSKHHFDIAFAEVTEYSLKYVNEKLGQNWKRFTPVSIKTKYDSNKEIFGVYTTFSDIENCNKKVEFELKHFKL